MDSERRSDLPRLYARGIAASRRRDAAGLGRVVVELIGRLNFEYEDAARRLGVLYLVALQSGRRGRFRRTLRIFRSLHAAASGSSMSATRSKKDVRGSTEST